MIDLTAACLRTAEVLTNVSDGHLHAPTPCENLRVAALLGHVGGLAWAFTAAAHKDLGQLTDTPPTDDAALDGDWRTAYPSRLTELAAAWRHPDAWTGMTRAGGVDLPGDVAGLIALNEVVIHGWDLARASGQAYQVDAATAQACLEFLAQFDAEGTEGMFGPAVPVADDASALDRMIGLSGRDPAWRP